MSDQPIHQIRVNNRDQSFECAEDQVLLIGMESHNARAISVGCRGGGCGVCKIRILSGDYETKRMSRAHISEQEQSEGYALACRVFPRADLVIESDHYTAPGQSAYQQAAAQLLAD